ncbi:MAG: F0F1 ATP synthase subunit B [Burkholderiales bacterium]|nr:F0F1 ATP synthase subunit B [Burkholderiales bacterium]
MDINATLIGQAIWFAIFIWFTMKFVWPPLQRAIGDRQKHIADGLAAAERGKHDLELASHRAEEILRSAKVQAQEIIGQADKRAAQIVEEGKEVAKQEGAKLVAGAQAEIEREISRAKEALRAQVAALAVTGASKILEREVDPRTHGQLLQSLGAEL